MIRRRKRFDNPLQQYWHILVKRQVTVLTCFLGAFVLTLLYNMSLGPLFRSNAKILIEDTTRWTGIQDSGRLTMEWYMTQFEILKSRPIIAKVVQKLDLTNQYFSNPTALETLKAKLRGRPAGKKQAGPNPEALIPEIQRSVQISPQTSTGLVQVSVVASSPVLARDITNALVDTFIEENLQAKMQLSFAANEYLTAQLQKISERIRESQKALEDFEKEEGLEGFRGQMPIGTQQFTDFVNKYIEAKTQAWELVQRLKVLESLVTSRDFNGFSSPQLQGTSISAQSQQLFDAQLRLEKLEAQGLMEKHPSVVQAKDEIDTLRKRLVFESRSYIAGLKSDLAATQERERSLFDMIQQSQKDVTVATKKQAQYDFLRREVEIQKGFYDSYDQQLKKLQLSADIKPSSVRVVERASEPAAPFSPNRRFNLGIGLFAGVFLGLFLAFFREYLDDTIKSAEDVQEYLEVPVLGTIPVIIDSKDKGALISRKVDTASLVVEAYRTLRTNLQFFETERPLQTILITSGGPAEGKSTTVANIGLTLVQMGKRVCLVDTDLRKPILHKIYNKPNKYGVTSMFAGVTDKKRLLMPCGFENLYLLPCGPIPPNPAELLASPRMDEAIKNLRKDFDYILFDSPPVLAVTDALVLSSLVDGVLVVIKSGEAKIGTCQLAMDSLTSIKANVIGVVLNQFNYRQSGYYRHYSKYYRYGYGYGYGYGYSQKEKEQQALAEAEPTESPEPRA